MGKECPRCGGEKHALKACGYCHYVSRENGCNSAAKKRSRQVKGRLATMSPAEMSKDQLISSIIKSKGDEIRRDALRLELQRRLGNRKSVFKKTAKTVKGKKTKKRDPSKQPVSQLTLKQIEKQIREGASSSNRLEQLKRERMHRKSGLYRYSIVMGGSPSLGRKR